MRLAALLLLSTAAGAEDAACRSDCFKEHLACVQECREEMAQASCRAECGAVLLSCACECGDEVSCRGDRPKGCRVPVARAEPAPPPRG